ncbi:hypothetical protein [Tellurirhabdus bombi]|uniref:hypothetical protein n=1 Tax=Tellurirhabdus bombi TaxID=2907205 RepID=UPI001F37DFDC|nr:hypothetical protein [Tellurirhabdus bombi]
MVTSSEIQRPALSSNFLTRFILTLKGTEIYFSYITQFVQAGNPLAPSDRRFLTQYLVRRGSHPMALQRSSDEWLVTIINKLREPVAN